MFSDCKCILQYVSGRRRERLGVRGIEREWEADKEREGKAKKREEIQMTGKEAEVEPGPPQNKLGRKQIHLKSQCV